jgi:hypothetical protein
LAATRAQRRRLSFGAQPDVNTRPHFLLFGLLCALFFALFSIVPAPADFLKPAQSLAL